MLLRSGDALDPAAVDTAVRGQAAVVFSLGGSSHRAPTTMFSDATRILTRAMETHGVRRLVCLTGIGAGDSRGRHGGFLYDKIIFPWFTKETYVDKDRQEALIRGSSLDWIIVRPASFTNGLQRGNLLAVTDLKDVTIRPSPAPTRRPSFWSNCAATYPFAKRRWSDTDFG